MRSCLFYIFFIINVGFISSYIKHNLIGIRNNFKSIGFLRSINNPIITKEIIENSSNYTISFIGNPRIVAPIELGDEWKLWFHARDNKISNDVLNLGCGRIYYLSSLDGLTDWKYHEDNPIINPSKEDGDWWMFDSEHVGLGDIFIPGNRAQEKFITMNGVYVMYTFGSNNDAIPFTNNDKIKGLKIEIGVAVSQDGIHFSKIEGPSPYAAILELGKENSFDSTFVGWPSIVELSNEYRMYYSTYDINTNKFSVCLAVATDGILNWVKKGIVFSGSDYDSDSFDNRGVTRRHVVRVLDGSYRMWYEGVSSNGLHSIGLATSPDGIKWTKASNKAVLSPSNDPLAWDSKSVGSPHLIWLANKKRWRMYYTGSSDLKEDVLTRIGESGQGIGVVESTDEFGLIFDKIN